MFESIFIFNCDLIVKVGKFIRKTSLDELPQFWDVFVGNMRTLQNQDAVLYFVNEIYPLIKNKEKDVEFHIVGAEPPEKIRQLAKSDKNDLRKRQK